MPSQHLNELTTRERASESASMDAVISRIRLVAIYVGLLLPVIAFGAFNALESINNSPIDWVGFSIQWISAQ